MCLAKVLRLRKVANQGSALNAVEEEVLLVTMGLERFARNAMEQVALLGSLAGKIN